MPTTEFTISATDGFLLAARLVETEVLQQTSDRIKGEGGAAEILGLNPVTVYFRMKKLGIEKSRFEFGRRRALNKTIKKQKIRLTI